VKLLILSVGKPDRGRTRPLFEDYVARLRRFGVGVEAGFVPEVRAGGRFSDAHVREREARALREALPARARTIALTPSGKPATSEQLAARLERWASPLAAFLIGGPLGLDPPLVRDADATLSLSPMTLPHELARLVLAEQLYRAVTLLRGVPYHK
jgi:23S rRNA (pseudouridine1915-N3)-methyltransferase